MVQVYMAERDTRSMVSPESTCFIKEAAGRPSIIDNHRSSRTERRSWRPLPACACPKNHLDPWRCSGIGRVRLDLLAGELGRVDYGQHGDRRLGAVISRQLEAVVFAGGVAIQRQRAQAI